MGNMCLRICPSTPGPEFDSKIRCSYFCCLQGATVKVIHNTHTDEVDGSSDITSTFIEEKEPIQIEEV
jgi:hypothetical protein